MKDIILVNMNKDLYRNDTFFPLGACYLRSALEENEFEVDFRDYQFTDIDRYFDIDNIVEFLEGDSNIIGISSMSAMLPFVVLALERFKKKHPEKVIILGGQGPTSVSEALLRNFNFIDIIVRGEGEETLIDLMHHLSQHKDLGRVKGISFRKNGNIHINPSREHIDNLDSLTNPYEYFDNLNQYKYKLAMASRGCAYNCIFCAAGELWGDSVRYHSIDRVIEDIKLIHKKTDNQERNCCIPIADDIFVLNRKRIVDFCEKLNRLNLKRITWSCNVKVGLIDEELMDIMSKSGCKRILYGLESGSDRILKILNKGFSIEQAMDTIVKSLKYFAGVTVNFMYGFPFETMDDFYESLLLFGRLNEAGVDTGFFLVSPFFKTKLYQQYHMDLEFDPELASLVVWTNGSALKRHKEAVQLIKKYQQTFMDFYYFRSGNVFKKKQCFDKVLSDSSYFQQYAKIS